MVSRMGKALKLDTEEPPPPEEDLVFGNINQEWIPQLSLAFIPTLMDLVKESWELPSTSSQVSCRVENLYCTHGNDTNFLLKHPPPNSIVVQSNQSKSSGKAKVTSTNREGHKLDVLVCRFYSFATFLLRVANYQAINDNYGQEYSQLSSWPQKIQGLGSSTHTRKQLQWLNTRG